MEKHFVEKYAGGFYFSSEDPAIIEGYGEDSGNGDNIIFSFDDEIEDDLFNKLGEYLTSKLFFTHDELMKKLDLCCVEQIGVYPALDAITIDAMYYIDDRKNFIHLLLNDNIIDEGLYVELDEYLTDELGKQLEFIKSVNGIGLAVGIEKKKQLKKEK